MLLFSISCWPQHTHTHTHTNLVNIPSSFNCLSSIYLFTKHSRYFVVVGEVPQNAAFQYETVFSILSPRMYHWMEADREEKEGLLTGRTWPLEHQLQRANTTVLTATTITTTMHQQWWWLVQSAQHHIPLVLHFHLRDFQINFHHRVLRSNLLSFPPPSS